MKGLSTELKVGLFAVIVLIILAFMTFKVGGLEWMKKKGNTFYVTFRNVAGLDEKTKVKVAGVDAGVIEKIQLKDGEARLTLIINKNVQLFSDAIASVKSTGLLGDKYLEIKTGSEKPVLKSGDTITNVIEVTDIDEMVRKLSRVSDNISTLTASLNEALGTEEGKKSLKETVTNLGEITSNINEAISVNDRKLRSTLDNIKNLTASINDLLEKNKEPITDTVANLKDFSGKLKSEGPELIANLNKATKELKDMVAENKPAIKSTVDSISDIAKKIDKGEGTLGKLVKDEHLYDSINKAAEGVERTFGAIERFRTFITFQADYLTRPKDAKGYFYVTLQPKPDRYYILGVVQDPIAKVTKKEIITKTSTGTKKVNREEIEKEIEFTAQFAKRFNNIALRAGLTENTFGAGVDYFFHNDKGRITSDVWDFSADEADAKSPHVRIGVDYFLFRNLFLSVGADNLLNKKWRGVYAGGGVRFEDEDLKYLFGIMPAVR